MFKVGLTGNIGSGKTTVSQIFATLGVPVINADVLSRIVAHKDSVKREIRDVFGAEVFCESGDMNRSMVAELVFNDPIKLEWLNKLLHPLIIDLFEEDLSHYNDSPYVVFEAAVLFEAKYDDRMDRVIVVTTPEELGISRVVERDGLSEKQIQARLKSQLPQNVKVSRSDFQIANDESEMLIPQVIRVHQAILENCS